jgi:hypothetical protein
MYREKLISQIEVLEKVQQHCNDVSAVRSLCNDILHLTRKVDELDEKLNENKPSQIFPEAVRQELAKSMKEAADSFAERHKNDKHYFW